MSGFVPLLQGYTRERCWSKEPQSTHETRKSFATVVPMECTDSKFRGLVSRLVAQSSILRPDKTLNIAPATVRFSESQMWLVVGIAKIMLFPQMLS
jgi:hypothetical protein